MKNTHRLTVIALLSALFSPLLAEQEAKPPDIAIKRMYGIRTSTYYVELDTNGQLKNLCVLDQRGKLSTQLVKDLSIPREDFLRVQKMSLELTGLNQTSRNEVEVIYTGVHQKDDGTVPESFRITYTFEDTEIRIKVKTKPGMYMGFEIGDKAQIAQNLNNSKEMALPPLQGVRIGYLQSMRITYADAAELLFRWTGPGNPLNVNENGGIQSWRRTDRIVWGMRGVTPHAEYDITYRIIRPARPGRVLAAPQFTVKTPVPAAIFFSPEEPKLSLDFERQDYQRILDLLDGRSPQHAEIEYRVTDQNEQEVDKGTVPIDFAKDGLGQPDGLISKTITLKPGKLGYFDASFRVTDRQRIFRPVWKERPFSVVEALKPAEEERKPMTEGRGWNGYYRNAFIGFGLIREQLDMKVAPEKGKFVFEARGWSLEKHFQNVKALRESSGVNSHFMLFHGSGVTWAKTPQDMFEVYKGILERFKGYNKDWETLNEPNIVLKPKEYLEMYLKPLKLAAEKVDPEANVIGFSMCGFGLDFIEEVYKLGGKDYFDAISIHPYIGTPYDVMFVNKMRELKRLMARYDDVGKPIWLTEGGFGWYNLASRTDRARHNVRRILIQDQFGIPKERDFYYFTTEHGYHQFYVMERDGTLLPQAVAMRAMKVRLDRTKYERHFGFGLRFAHCNIYKADDRQVAVLWTYDNTRTLELKTDATEAKGFDMWSNPVKLEVKDGKLAVPVSGEPTYVILPVDAKVSPVWDTPGRNVADLAFGAEVTASSEATPADLVLDGVWDGGGWRDGTQKRFPDWIEIALPLPETIDRCHIYASGGCIRDLDVLGEVEGKAVEIAKVRGNLDATLDIQFKPVTVKKVRFEVLAGPPNSDWVVIHETELFAAEKEGATDQEWINWAAAKNGATATASSVWKLETEYPEADPNRGSNFAVSDRRVQVTVEYAAAQAIDGNFMPNRWQEYIKTVWIDGTPKQFPDWLQVDFDGSKTINAVLVFVNNFSRFKPRETGISDCDLEVWQDGKWLRAGSVKGNTKGVISFALKDPVKTNKIRILVHDTNDHDHSTIMEIQALGRAEKP